MLSTNQQEFQPLNASGLRPQIEEQIMSVVLSGQFRPGQRLVESVIAEQLQVSRSPVRETLSALEREGIVEYRSRRGYFLINFTIKDIEEIYSLRQILELNALQRVVKQSSNADIAPMQEFVDALGIAVRERRDYQKIAALDLSFHQYICQLADHSRLFSAWKSMRMQTLLLIGMTSKTEYDYLEQPREFHQDILNAILDRDLARAEKLLSEHILDAKMRALAALDNHNRNGQQ
ncbi:MAG: GntR family transcriptional regulator [Chloroflexota bacterium]